MNAQALVLEAPQVLSHHELPVPVVGPDEALLRVEACGLCGTDHEQYSGELHPGYGFIPGHESVGTLAEVGAIASQRWGLSKGDRVAVEVFQSCGACEECRNGEVRRCISHGIGDMYGFIPVDTFPGLWGGYAQYQYLSADSILHRVPPGLDPVVATLFNPLGAGFRWGVTIPHLQPGQAVAVLGPGIRGISACAAMKEAGAAFVMVAGRGPRDHIRLEAARSFGADIAVDVDEEDPARAFKRASGGLADIVLDVTAKAPGALGQAVALARDGGTIVLAGTKGSADTPGFWPDMLIYKELTVLGALGVDSAAYISALDLLASGCYPFAELPRMTAGLDGAEELLQIMGGLGGAPGADSAPPPVHGVVVPWR